MPAAPDPREDTFVRFVDSLAANLDDVGARGAALAARAHLSRYHFDRVVSGVCGETPFRFRRRVLLERAAYRLSTAGGTILDVAVEAGYGSHEAFTRAFRKAYGVPPTAWRADPGRYQLWTPNGVHFHPPGSLRLPARTKVTEMDLLVRMVEHHIWLIGRMIDEVSELPEGTLDEPIEVSVDDGPTTLRGLLSRLVGQMHRWTSTAAGRPYDWSLERGESLASMRQRLAAAGRDFLAEVRAAIADGRLEDTFVDATCDPPEVYTYGGMIAHVLTFAAHNRTLVALALKRAGRDGLGWGDPMKWVTEPAPPPPATVRSGFDPRPA